ncbi:MAG: preQ(1) synthase [Tannerellaceae bacterium]|jgi:7-cyano-7-deazaguanine reductase|nr:preQ(1) synthase [Tannerellaceae bacterium]
MQKDELHSLGAAGTQYPHTYSPQLLETFANPHPGHDYRVHFCCPEFTCLCPVTGQPDFATILVDYIPDLKMVESKSLKLYLFSFRSHGGFHEDCVNIILNDLVELMAPRYIEVEGLFTARGGISIHPYCNYGQSGTIYERIAREQLFQSKIRRT